MLKKQLLIFSFLIFSTALFARPHGNQNQFGTIKGIVVDTSGKPLEAISVVILENQKYATLSDSSGHFELQVPANQTLTAVFSSSSLSVIPFHKSIEVKPGQVLTFTQPLIVLIHDIGSVTIKAQRSEDTIGIAEVKSQPFSSSPNESFESTLAAQAMGVHSTNELSSTYSVRGGNFDENLVYVNDFEILRPFLIRSAEQEGLSFVNPDMVDDVKFSSGGFQAKYGDKMSSVMDVTYHKPDSLKGNFYASLLGFGGHIEGTDKKKRLAFSLGLRQRLSTYILQSQDTKGSYSPNFLDIQGFLTYTINEKSELQALVNYSRNQFNFVPVDRSTTFGLLTNVINLEVYYDGQELDQYQASTDGLAYIYKPNDNLRIKFLGSYTLDREQENYDIIGQYYLSQVNSNLGSSTFGQNLYSLGTGGIENWSRDALGINVYYAGTRGSFYKNRHNLQWGLDYKHEMVQDKLSEWNMVDSAGYSVPYVYTQLDSNGNIVNNKSGIGFNSVLNSTFQLNSNRYAGFVQDTWRFGDSLGKNKFTLNYGVRFEYWDVNKEPIATPRAQFSYKPRNKADLLFTASTGLYYQPPFYREMRNDFTGVVNTSLKAQKSYHAVVGLNYSFRAWNRPFNFSTEAYYKLMWDLVPYSYNDVQIQYLGNNSGKGYAYGIDARLNGELAKGVQSWISIGVMQAEQTITGLSYTAYYDSAHQQIPYSTDNLPLIRDSATVKAGKFPLPTDQRINFNMYFQDVIPQFPFIQLHINLVFATGLPFGPPGDNFYLDQLRMDAYKRVDMGFSGQLWSPTWAKRKNKFNQGLKGVWLSLEIFNIFGITNVASYLWVRDAQGDQYAVPNYLTPRLVNAKLIVNL